LQHIRGRYTPCSANSSLMRGRQTLRMTRTSVTTATSGCRSAVLQSPTSPGTVKRSKVAQGTQAAGKPRRSVHNKYNPVILRTLPTLSSQLTQVFRLPFTVPTSSHKHAPKFYHSRSSYILNSYL